MSEDGLPPGPERDPEPERDPDPDPDPERDLEPERNPEPEREADPGPPPRPAIPIPLAAPRSPREAVAEMRVRAPTRGNRRLERFLEAVNADDQVKAWWHVSAVNATRRLGMSDHSWVHIQIVLNIGLRLARLLFRRGVVPSIVADFGMSERDAEVVIAAGCLLHCVGMSIHRDDHERYSLFLTAGRIGSLLASGYEEPERTIVASEALHAIIGHRRKGNPFTVEAGIVRVADALDMARGRSRVPFESGRLNIHSLSAYAIEEVKISPGTDRAVRVEIQMSNSAGIYQVDELLATKLRGSGLEEHIEVIARIDAEVEERLIPVFRI
jgi:metal-dependent HD superfamily phosphatase/phosphodiesterase